MTGWGSMEIAIEALRAACGISSRSHGTTTGCSALVRQPRRSGGGTARRGRPAGAGDRDARRIQLALLPRILPQFPGWSFAAACEAAAPVGGDTYDVMPLADGTSRALHSGRGGQGHPGCPARLEPAGGGARGGAGDACSLPCCALVNRALCEPSRPTGSSPSSTACSTPRPASCATANAGHNPPSRRPTARRVAGCRRREVLGHLDRIGWRRRGGVATGQRLVLYTDGITEASDAAGEEFGDQSPARCASDAGPPRSAPALLDAVFDAVRSFARGNAAGRRPDGSGRLGRTAEVTFPDKSGFKSSFLTDFC